MPVLVLGGTGEARQLAQMVSAMPEFSVTLSLAGRTARPQLPQGPGLQGPVLHVRSGGFGGADGLADYLRRHDIRVLVDATHPFAARISAHAVIAARATGVPLIVIDRPAWSPQAGDRWIDVGDMHDAATVLDAEFGAARQTVFLAIGRQEVAPFRAAPRHRYIVRSIEPVAPEHLPLDSALVLARGPFAAEAEHEMLRQCGVTVLVSKNSGGAATHGKLVAARQLGLPVIMVQRPPLAVADDASAIVVPDVAAALESLRGLGHALVPRSSIERGE